MSGMQALANHKTSLPDQYTVTVPDRFGGWVCRSYSFYASADSKMREVSILQRIGYSPQHFRVIGRVFIKAWLA